MNSTENGIQDFTNALDVVSVVPVNNQAGVMTSLFSESREAWKGIILMVLRYVFTFATRLSAFSVLGV